ncbi:hypothetical protein [Metabacillus sp. RGM 3146]|uniref:hypothetical protein n=1 Tax=Metabacillus sp. RGM 3146 TaxID=3401092 RepID=UPI003B9CE74C
MTRKSLTALFFVLSLLMVLVSGCAQADEKGKAAETMKNVYAAAEKHDKKTFKDLFSHSNIADEELNLSMIMFGDKADAAGGIKNLKFTEIPKDKLKDDAAKMLTDQYKDNWQVVYEESKVSTPYFWIIQKLDGKYYVVNGDESAKKDIVKE